MRDSLEPVLAAGGVAFAAAVAAAALVQDERAVAYLLGLAAFFLVAFFGALRAALRAAEGETAPLSATAVIAGSVTAAGYALLAADAASVARADYETDVGYAEFAFLVSFAQAAAVGAAATVIVRTAVLPRSLGVAGQALVPLQLGAPLVVLSTESDEFGTGLAIAPFCLWVLAASVLLLRRPTQPSPRDDSDRV